MNSEYTDRTILVGGQPPAQRRPDFWAKLLSEFMDVLAYGAIFMAGEVQTWAIWIALGLTAVRLITRLRFRPVWVFSGFILLIFFGLQLSLRNQLHPLLSAAHVAPIALAWMGFTRGAEDIWGWRVGLGFISLILASALSPDFSVTLIIASFIVAGSVNISCRFLDLEFTKRGVIGTLPRGFIRSSIKQTGILFLSALVIFPMIPRVQGKSGSGGGFGNDPAKTGYTEEIGLSEWGRVSSRGSSAPALRIYGPDGKDPNDYIPAGLLRSRVLSVLSETRWDPLPTKLDYRLDHDSGRGTLQIVREMLGPANIPVPYGTLSTSVELYGYRWQAEKTVASEWRENRSRNLRYNYSVTVGSQDKWRPQDAPTQVDLRVPEKFQTARMKELVSRLFKGLKDPTAKIQAVQGLLIRDFRAVYLEDENPSKASAEDKTLPPLERFLFVEKSGHCELFASSMAVLLRMGGVPARLIAGFRVTRNAMGDVLTVRQQDAHAWVEVYIPGFGWRPYDPTPKVLHTTAITDWLRDSYDWASAKWTQYILKYGEEGNSLSAQWETFKRLSASIASGKNPFKNVDTEVNTYLFLVIFVVGSAVLSTIAVAIFRTLRRKRNVRKESSWIRMLMRERESFERAIVSHSRRNPARTLENPPEVDAWIRLYEAARFGRVEESERSEVFHRLRSKREEIFQSWKSA